MPQLWIETWVGQYFWLLVILFCFHFYMVNTVIPTIATIFKIRKTLGIKQDEVTADSKLLDPDSLKIDLTTSTPEIASTTNFGSVRSSWIKNTKVFIK